MHFLGAKLSTNANSESPSVFRVEKDLAYLLRFSFGPFPLLLRWVCVANKEEGTEGPIRGVDVED